MSFDISRRKFLGSASLGVGTLGVPNYLPEKESEKRDLVKLPHAVTVGTISIADITAANTQDMIQQVLAKMEDMARCKPDIICLPEIFAFAHIPNFRYRPQEVAEKVPGPVVTPFLNFAARHKCYVICPTYSLSGGNIYISAVLIDRQGKVIGEYHKNRPAAEEMKMGITPGKTPPPVFQTDFGKIGIQICFDIKYDDGWNHLKDNGAQIIFWPSAYSAGREINSRAWRHQVYVVTSTQKDSSKICDMTGEVISQTGRWQNWACTSINLEKVFVLAWPAVSKFPDILRKYGDRIRLNTFSEEEWAIFESLDKDLKIADVLNDFNIKTAHDALKELAILHKK